MTKERKVTSGYMDVVQTEEGVRNPPVSPCSTTRKGVGVTTALNRTCQTTLDTFMLMGIKRMKYKGEVGGLLGAYKTQVHRGRAEPTKKQAR